MLEVVHITFEKIAGLGGDIEGIVMCDRPERIDKNAPIIFRGFTGIKMLFTQMDECFFLQIVEVKSVANFNEHFSYGTNFLIKEWSNGGGVRTTDVSKNLN